MKLKIGLCKGNVLGTAGSRGSNKAITDLCVGVIIVIIPLQRQHVLASAVIPPDLTPQCTGRSTSSRIKPQGTSQIPMFSPEPISVSREM